MCVGYLRLFTFYCGTLYTSSPSNTRPTQRITPRARGGSRSLTETEKATLEGCRKQFTFRTKKQRQQLVSDLTITRQPGGAVDTSLLPARMVYTPAPGKGRKSTTRPSRSTRPLLLQPPPTDEQDDHLKRMLQQQNVLATNPNAELPLADILDLPEPESLEQIWRVLRNTINFRYQVPFDPNRPDQDLLHARTFRTMVEQNQYMRTRMLDEEENGGDDRSVIDDGSPLIGAIRAGDVVRTLLPDGDIDHRVSNRI